MRWTMREQPPIEQLMDDLQCWFATELGQALLAAEQELVNRLASRLYGYHMLQIGFHTQTDLPQNHLLHAANGGHLFSLIPRLDANMPENSMVADPAQLPFANDCIDVVLLQHGLDFASAPHQVLREAARVLRPGGKLLVLGFNPLSTWGVVHLFRSRHRRPPWGGHFFTAGRLEDWLQLLGFGKEQLLHGGFLLPFANARWRQRLQRLEKWEGRYARATGALLLLMASKETLALVGPKHAWRRRLLFPVRRPAATRARRQGARPAARNGSVNRQSIS